MGNPEQMTLGIEKSEITVSPPGSRMYAIKRNPSGNIDKPSAQKRELAGIYYEMYRKHPWVRAGIDKIAKSAANPDISFTPSDPEGEIVALHKKNLQEFFRKSKSKKLLRATYKDLLIYGEAFWLVDITFGGKPIKAQRLHPKYMDAVVNEEATEVISWRYGPFHHDEDAIYYDPSIVLHFAIEDPDSDLVGLSPLSSLQDTVAQDLFAMTYNRSFYENSAQTGTIFNMRNATQDEITRNRVWLEENYVGAQNAHRPIILEGDIEVEKSVANSQEMQFIEGRKVNRAEIFGVLDIAPEKVGINEDSNRSVSKEADNSFREDTIGPLQSIVEEEVNDVLILEIFGYDDILFRHDESDKRSRLALMTIYRDALRDGIWNRNEVRGELGQGPIEGGDEYTISTSAGVVPLKFLLKRPDPATGAVAPAQSAPEAEGVNPNEQRNDSE